MADINQLMTALRNADAAGNTEDAKRIAELIKQAQSQQAPKDGALSYSVDQAQRLGGQMVRTIGSAFDFPTLTEFGNKIVEQQDKDIKEGGYVSPLGNMSFLDAVSEGKGMQWVATRGAENATTIGATPVIAVGTALSAWLGAPAIVTTGLGLSATATGLTLGVGSVTDTAEQKGLDVEDQSTAQKNLALGVVVGALDRIGASKLIPKGKVSSMTNGEIAETLAKKDPNLAKRFIKEVWSGAKAEGVTEAAQSGVEISGVAAQGGEFTTDEVINDVVDNFVLGASAGGTIKGTAQAGKEVVKKATGDPKPTEDNEAAADFARDLEEVTSDDGFDLKDVDPTSTEGARAAIDAVHKNYTGQMQALIQALKDQLKLKDTDPEVERLNKVQAKIGFDKARNKTKNTVGKKDFEAVNELVGNTKEGQQLLALMRKSNELTRVHNNGLKGGISRLTDALNPFDSNTGYSNQRTMASPLIGAASAGAAYGTGGATIMPQLAAVLGGRGIDALTGRRSRVAKFVRDNANKQGMSAPSGQSVIQQRIDAETLKQLAQQSQADREAADKASRERINRLQGAQGAEATPGSPQDILEQSTGLDKNGVAEIMRYIINQGNAEPALIKAINEYRISIDTGGKISNDMLSPLIKAVNDFIRLNPKLADRRIAEPVRKELTETEDRRRRGEVANKKALRSLRDAVDNDKSIPISDKAILKEALAELGGKLGRQPLNEAFDILARAEERLRRKDLVDKYLTPYLERILKQSRGKSDEAA